MTPKELKTVRDCSHRQLFHLLLQFTTDIAIYDDCYYNLRQVLQFTTLLQFTTEQSALNVTPGKTTLLAR